MLGNMKEVVGNHIVNAIDFDERKATAMETISKDSLMQEKVTEKVVKSQVEEEEMNVIKKRE
jgi:hypothetical protein